MPLYEYQCQECNHVFERIQKFSDEPVKICPECGGPVQQLLSAPAIQFKGSGWYVNDYAKQSGSGAKGNGSGKTDVSASESKSESKAETKDGTKPASSPSSDKK